MLKGLSAQPLPGVLPRSGMRGTVHDTQSADMELPDMVWYSPHSAEIPGTAHQTSAGKVFRVHKVVAAPSQRA